MQTALEQELATLLVSALDLEDVEAGGIIPDAPMFGFESPDSLGLDSIDALEIALAVSTSFGVQLKADDENNRAVFASLRSLAQFIDEHKSLR